MPHRTAVAGPARSEEGICLPAWRLIGRLLRVAQYQRASFVSSVVFAVSRSSALDWVAPSVQNPVFTQDSRHHDSALLGM